jgi:hypothetical protein
VTAQPFSENTIRQQVRLTCSPCKKCSVVFSPISTTPRATGGCTSASRRIAGAVTGRRRRTGATCPRVRRMASPAWTTDLHTIGPIALDGGAGRARRERQTGLPAPLQVPADEARARDAGRAACLESRGIDVSGPETGDVVRGRTQPPRCACGHRASRRRSPGVSGRSRATPRGSPLSQHWSCPRRRDRGSPVRAV